MPITAIIAEMRCRCWPDPEARAASRQEQRRRYHRRYMAGVYRKNHKARNITLSQAEDKRLRAAAAAFGRKPAVLLRQAAFAYLEGRALLPAGLEAALAAYTLEVRRIGTNINQLAHQANARPADTAASLDRATVLLERLEACGARLLPPPAPPGKRSPPADAR